MHSIADSPLGPELSSHFNLDGHGRLRVGQATRSFGFQVTVQDLQFQPSLIFGLARADGAQDDARFAVRIDMDTGRIWDAAHDTGVIGFLDATPYPGREDLRNLRLRWQVERAGDALIPRLHLADEEFLYPAVRLLDDAPFVAFTGHDALELESSAIFSASHVWTIEKLG